MTAAWRNRWLRVAMAVIAVACWPACNRNTEAPGGPPVVGAPPADEALKGTPANLAFSFRDVTGKTVALSAFRGKPLLLNVWATWCGPCRLEIPWFVDFMEKYSARDLNIIGVSYDDPPAEIEAFAKKLNVKYPMLVGLGHDDFFAVYDAEGIYPVSWLVRADGTVQARAVGAQPREWFEQQIEAMF